MSVGNYIDSFEPLFKAISAREMDINRKTWMQSQRIHGCKVSALSDNNLREYFEELINPNFFS